MAVVVQGQKDEKDPSQALGTISTSGAASAAIAPGTTAATGQDTTAGRRTSGSGRFTNIQSYLDANKGAGQKIAGQIGQNVGKQSEKLGQAVESFKGVNTQLDAEKSRIAQATGFQQQLQQDPTQLTADPNKTQQFSQLYSGQTNLNPAYQQAQQAFNTAQSQAGNVQNLANLTGSEQGRFELLRQSLGRPTYTQGQQRLDQLLVQSGGKDILSNLQKETQAKATAGQQLLGQTQQDIEGRFQGLSREADLQKSLLRQTMGGWDDPTTEANEATGVLGGLQTDLTGRASQKQAQFEDIYNRARSGLESGEIDRDVAEMLGLTGISTAVPGAAPGGQVTSGQLFLGDTSPENLLSRLQKGFDQVTASGVANEGDYAKLQALKQLSGQTGPTPIELDKAKLGQAGKAVNFDAQALQSDVQNRLNELQSQYSGTQVDALGAQKLMGGGAAQVLGNMANLSNEQLIDRFYPELKGSAGANMKVAQLRAQLQQQQQKFQDMSASQPNADDYLGNLGGLTYGRLGSGSDDLVGNLGSYLQRYMVTQGGDTGEKQKNLIKGITSGLTGADVQQALMGGSFGGNMQDRMSQLYSELGLNKTLKIK